MLESRTLAGGQESWKIFPGIAKLKLHNTSKFPSSLASSFFVKKFKEESSHQSALASSILVKKKFEHLT